VSLEAPQEAQKEGFQAVFGAPEGWKVALWRSFPCFWTPAWTWPGSDRHPDWVWRAVLGVEVGSVERVVVLVVRPAAPAAVWRSLP